MSGWSHRLLEHFFQNSENRAIARCNRKTRQLDFRKAEATLVPAAAPRAQRNPRLPGLLMAALGAIAFAPALAIFARHADRSLGGRKSLKD
jgi:hypothetical protein